MISKEQLSKIFRALADVEDGPGEQSSQWHQGYAAAWFDLGVSAGLYDAIQGKSWPDRKSFRNPKAKTGYGCGRMYQSLIEGRITIGDHNGISVAEVRAVEGALTRLSLAEESLDEAGERGSHFFHNSEE